MNIIERLEELETFDFDDEGEIPRDKYGYYIRADDLRAIIEEYKATAQEPVAYMFCGNLSGVDLLSFNEPDSTNSLPNTCVPLFTHPQLSDETVKDAGK